MATWKSGELYKSKQHGQEQHGRDVALAVVYVEKNRVVAFVITTPVCIALIRDVRGLFTP